MGISISQVVANERDRRRAENERADETAEQIIRILSGLGIDAAERILGLASKKIRARAIIRED